MWHVGVIKAQLTEFLKDYWYIKVAQAITYKDLQKLTYNEVRGTGLAAVCPIIEEGTTNVSEIKPGSYKLQQLCLEPTKIWVSAGTPVPSCALHPFRSLDLSHQLCQH